MIQCAPSPQSCPHTTSPGRAAGGPLRGFVPQVQAVNQRLLTCGGVRRMSTPMCFSARAGGVATADTCGGTPAAGHNPAEGTSRHGARSRRRYITARVTLKLVLINPAFFLCPMCTSAQLPLFCCDSARPLKRRGGGASGVGERQRAPARNRELRRLAELRAGLPIETEHRTMLGPITRHRTIRAAAANSEHLP